MYTYIHSVKVREIYHRLLNQKNTKRYLGELKEHHRETYDHSLRVAKLSIDLALENRLPIRTVKTIGRAALLHDYGKSRIDEEILSKRGPLDEGELALMKRHPRLGLVELEKFLTHEVRKIIISHHEFKAEPYPRTVHERRENIRLAPKDRRKQLSNPLTQIVAAADMYDALSFSRSYKESFPPFKVKQIMLEQFTGHPSLINQLFKRVLQKAA